MRKKCFITIILVISIICTTAIVCSAKTVDDKNMGLSYTISDNWIDISNGDGYSYYHKDSPEEFISISMSDSGSVYSIELSDEEVLKNICASIYSDEHLAEGLTKENGVFVTVNTDSEVSNFEVYNGRRFYRYEKAYTASAVLRKNTPFYTTVFITIQNGKVYLFEYQRNYSDAQHFSDVASLLDSLSFENGEIKILINGERIYPDTAPILYNDRTLVPIRAIAEKMGYSVAWDEGNQLVILTSLTNGNVLYFEIGSSIALKNMNETIELDVPAVILGDRTYLPLRAVAEAMDANVTWNEGGNSVVITD